MKPEVRERLTVAVIMQRRDIHHGQWTVPHWTVLGVVAGDHLEVTEDLTVSGKAGEPEQMIWPGLVLEFAKSGAESYWYNLVGERPSLFVICRPDDEERLVPYRVTADPDEASAHMEVDDAVFSVSIPTDIHQRLEHYVVENYVPRQTKKRQREKWTKEESDVRPKPH